MSKWGIIGAMVEEIELLRTKMNDVTETVKAGIRFYEGTLQGQHVVLCKSGVGKVNAAVCTQLLIERFHAGKIVFTGVAGALDPSLEIGDIVISTDCMQHDMDVTALGFARGVIPYERESIFAANPVLAESALSASREVHSGTIVQGRILSGDQFIASRETVKQLHEELNGACTEMEGASVAQVSFMNGIPFVVIRSMSDKADGTAHVNFTEFAARAAETSCRIVEKMLASAD